MATQPIDAAGAAWQGLVEEMSGQPPYRTRIAGTGIEVWEVIKTWREEHGDWAGFRESYYWINEDNLRAVVAYDEAHAESIDARLIEEEHGEELMKRLWRDYPGTRPPHQAG